MSEKSCPLSIYYSRCIKWTRLLGHTVYLNGTSPRRMDRKECGWTCHDRLARLCRRAGHYMMIDRHTREQDGGSIGWYKMIWPIEVQFAPLKFVKNVFKDPFYKSFETLYNQTCHSTCNKNYIVKTYFKQKTVNVISQSKVLANFCNSITKEKKCKYFWRTW